ncbi:MAG: hypothetical protein LQ350_001465 [Teloschistes chrysophthalmus]|nr:MAG: hypothetical protein LQ350_001465 [Niorma chrysophthalma]
MNQEFDDGFHELVQHNSGTTYQPNPLSAENNAYQHSGASTAYHSPEAQHAILEYDPRYYHGGAPSYYEDPRFGVYGVDDQSNHGGMAYPIPPNAYQGMVSSQTNYIPNPYQFSSTSTTPEPRDQGDRSRRMRNGRSAPPNGSSALGDGSQSSNSPRPKRAAKKSKIQAVGEASISAPLSQLCLDVPVVDVFEKVNRPIEARQEEARKDNKIKRPSNSFMLYRSAYGDRVKALYPQNNHQIISRICGASWKMETPEVTEKFKAYYEMEKENHAKAHPTYKFSPAKASPSRKRRGTGETSDEEDGTDIDAEYRPRGGRRPRPTKVPRSETPTSYPASLANPLLGSYQPALIHPTMGYDASSWQASNPGKPLPAPMNSYLADGHMYHTSVVPRGSSVEDVFMYRAEAPRPQLQLSSQALVGLPGGSHEELLGVSSAEDSPSPQVDPLLLNFDDEFPGPAHRIAHDQAFGDLDDQGHNEQGSDQTTGPTSTSEYQSTFDPWHVNGDGGEGEGDLDWLK